MQTPRATPMIVSAQKVEHYEIASYGAVRTPAAPRGGGSEETLGPQVYFPGACRSALMNGSAAAGTMTARPVSTTCGLTSLPYRSWLSSLSGRTTPPDRFTPANRPCVRE